MPKIYSFLMTCTWFKISILFMA